MARPAKGHVAIDLRTSSPTFGLRFTAGGKRRYVRLGTAAEGWTPTSAHIELQNVLADVRRGIWQPAIPPPAPEITEDPTFHKFATDWFAAVRGELRPKTVLDYEWQLSCHLLPFFRGHRLSQITVQEVDRYRQTQVRRDQISASSINKTITRLAQILEVAVEYELIDRNPARGRRRRLKVARPVPVWLDSAEQIEALLDAAGALDARARLKGGRDQKGGLEYRRALLATFLFAGLRIGELTDLRWRDVDLLGKRLLVREAKTDAGVREVDILPVLRRELVAHHRKGPYSAHGDYVFPSAVGTKIAESNIRRRVLDKAIADADKTLAKADEAPLPAGLTPHKLRHTFASILVALGVDPGTVMDQLGHADPAFTLRIYRHGMRRDPAAKQRLRALVACDGVRQRRARRPKRLKTVAQTSRLGREKAVAGHKPPAELS
jgi:integrase